MQEKQSVRLHDRSQTILDFDHGIRQTVLESSGTDFLILFPYWTAQYTLLPV
jgi:hypothetical protein